MVVKPRALLPRLVKVQTPQLSATPGDASRWWRDDRYVDFDSRKALRWLGRNWVSWHYKKFPGSYLADATDLVTLLDEMASKGIVGRLTRESRVFEGGCNLGRNLLALQDAYGCEVSGMDLSPTAIRYATERVWVKRSRWNLWKDDALTSAWFAGVKDGEFDLVISRWHLIHIPASPRKTEYIAHLKRIARVLLVLEPLPQVAGGSIEYHYDGAYCLSRDDWAKAYGLREFKPSVAIESTGVYYYSSAK